MKFIKYIIVTLLLISTVYSQYVTHASQRDDDLHMPFMTWDDNPEGLLEGDINDFVFDTVNVVLYWKQTGAATTTGWVEYAPTSVADADYGEITVASGIWTVDDDVIGSEHFKDQDWGDIAVSANVVSVEDDSHLHGSGTITEADPLALLTAGTDNVKDSHPDWGTGAGQISAEDIPIADVGVIIVATEVEGALQENRLAIDLNTSKVTMTYPGAGIALSTGSAWSASITDNSANWNTAYTDRLKWDGGATDLVASTGRTSLGGTTIGQALFLSTNPGAITFGRANADNSFDWLSATNFRTAIGVDPAGTDNSTDVTLNANATAAGLSLSTQEINYRAATNAQTGYMTAALVTNIETNNAKITNVSTALSVGTVGVNTVAITSDGGADDVTLPAATVTTAGMFTTAKWAEVVANNAKVSNVSTALSTGTRDATTYGINSDGSSDDVILVEATTTLAGLLGAAKWDEIVASTTHLGLTNNPHSVTKAQVGLTNVEDVALSTWVGSTNLTTLGIIGTGTWQSVDVGIGYGGTGQSTAQAAIDALSQVSGGTNEYVLTKDTGTGNALWKVSASGFADPMTTRGDIVIRDASNNTERLGIGANAFILTSDGTDVSWSVPAINQELQNSLVGSYYHFDGVDDIVTVSDNADIDFGTNDFSIAMRFYSFDVAGTEYLLNKEAGGIGYGIYKTDDDIYIRFDDNTTDASAIILTAKIVAEKWYDLVITFDRDGNSTAYLGGNTGTVDISGTPLTLDNAGDLLIGSTTAGASFFKGEISHILFFNRLLTSNEAIEISKWDSDNPPVWFSNVGANQTELTSGTLTIGKRYRINDWITADDFTNIGGTNEDGNEFIATGTTPTTWTNSSTVVPIGNVVNYNGNSIGMSTWFDVSGNNNYGTVTGAMQLLPPIFGNQEVRGIAKIDTLITKYPRMDVRYFGAIGDGVTDDTDAVQEAIDSANVYMDGYELIKSVAYFPPGDYLVDSLTIYPGTHLKGESKYTSRISASQGTGTYFINVDELGEGHGGNIAITDLAIVGTGGAQKGVRFYHSYYNSYMRECRVEGFYDNVTVDDSWTFTLKNSYLRSAGRHNLFIKTGTNVTIEGNRIDYSGSHNIRVGRVSVGLTIRDNAIQKADSAGVRIDSTLIANIENNFFEDNGKNDSYGGALEVFGYATTILNVTHNVFNNNSVVSNMRAVLLTGLFRNFTGSGNKFHGTNQNVAYDFGGASVNNYNISGDIWAGSLDSLIIKNASSRGVIQTEYVNSQTYTSEIQGNVDQYQIEDDSGWKIYGFDDKSAEYGTLSINSAGNFVIGSSGDILLNLNYPIQGLSTGKSFERSIVLQIQPGATPNTNINITNYGVSTNGFNHPSITDATDLAASGTSGSFSLSANGIDITFNITPEIIGLGTYAFVKDHEINNSSAELYKPAVDMQSGNLRIKIIAQPGGQTSWLPLMDTGDAVYLSITFWTST